MLLKDVASLWRMTGRRTCSNSCSSASLYGAHSKVMHVPLSHLKFVIAGMLRVSSVHVLTRANSCTYDRSKARSSGVNVPETDSTRVPPSVLRDKVTVVMTPNVEVRGSRSA